MKLKIEYILFLYLFTLFTGTLFFIPAIFVNRVTTAPALWMQAGISIGILGYVLLTKERISLPTKGFILLLTIWTVFHLWQSRGNIENKITIITLMAVFFLFYAILSNDTCLLIFDYVTHNKLGFQENFICLVANTNLMVHLLQINAYVD